MAGDSAAAGVKGVKGVEFRKKWDKEEYAEKAKQRDEDEKDRMKENEERLKQGPSPLLVAS
jgi:U4/U6.U5 tri-snRNP component SNU23